MTVRTQSKSRHVHTSSNERILMNYYTWSKPSFLSFLLLTDMRPQQCSSMQSQLLSHGNCFKPCGAVQLNRFTWSCQTAFRYTLVHSCTKFYSPCHRSCKEKHKFKKPVLYLLTDKAVCVCAFAQACTHTCVAHLYSKFVSRNQAFCYMNYVFH